MDKRRVRNEFDILIIFFVCGCSVGLSCSDVYESELGKSSCRSNGGGVGTRTENSRAETRSSRMKNG